MKGLVVIYGVFVCLVAFFRQGDADFMDHLKKDLSEKVEISPLRGIDFIYMVNLDQRPEKWEKSIKELASYEIKPHRFSAVYGWGLSGAVLQELGVKFEPGMLQQYWVSYYTASSKPEKKREFLREESYGKSVFSSSLELGAIGCTLSHLSILQDAYESGYETIWVLEDDIAVKRDPKLLPDLIDRLDALIGKEAWDILYTDMDSDVLVENYMQPYYPIDNDYQTDLKGELYFFWRPDLALLNRDDLKKRRALSSEFLHVGSRSRTHSMIIRRNGMKKILEFAKQHHIFLPYDHELAVIPGIQLINLRESVVTFAESPSDTDNNFFSSEKPWEECKQKTLNGLPNLFGWYEDKQIHRLMDSVKKKKPKLCVEIGAFGGILTYSIANSLHFLKEGTLYAIDAWNADVAVQGIKGEKTLQWWRSLDMNGLYEKFCSFFASGPLKRYVHPIRKTSKEVVSSFADESIDFLVLDGNPSAEQSLEDTLMYFPKVKEGGYIWVQNAQLESKNASVAFLFKHCHWIEEESSVACVLFEKKKRSGCK